MSHCAGYNSLRLVTCHIGTFAAFREYSTNCSLYVCKHRQDFPGFPSGRCKRLQQIFRKHFKENFLRFHACYTVKAATSCWGATGQHLAKLRAREILKVAMVSPGTFKEHFPESLGTQLGTFKFSSWHIVKVAQDFQEQSPKSFLNTHCTVSQCFPSSQSEGLQQSFKKIF